MEVSPIAVATASTHWAKIALVGVLRTGWTLPNHLGNAPSAPILYHIRVDTLPHAIDKAMTELTSMRSRIPHALPQNCLARVMPGSSMPGLVSTKRSVPQPIITPHWTMTMKIPKRITDPMRARGTFRVGFSDSSAIGAEPSQPVNAWMANTAAMNRPAVLDAFDGLNGWRFSPPGPGLARPQRPSRKTTMSSMPPVMISVLPDSWTPKNWTPATIVTMTRLKPIGNQSPNVPVHSSELEMTYPPKTVTAPRTSGA